MAGFCRILSPARGRAGLSTEMEGWMLWSNLSRLVNGAPVERDLGCLYESNLFEGVVEDFELLHCQVPVDLYYYPLDAYACARSSVQDLSILEDRGTRRRRSISSDCYLSVGSRVP